MKNMCIILGLFISSCSYSQKNEEHKFTNNLINETSPYLLQHAHNPVNWYAWGDEALAKAKKENKLLLISIGYAACHWCHVMEHECFEDEQVAKYMNDNFICIKVDREERPDIDMVYMNAVQLLSGSGGWPLNCIALPDGKPFYGGTYFPKDKWLNMLKGVRDFVRKNPQEAAEQADLLTKGIASSERIVSNASISKFSENDLDVIFTNWEKNIDFKRGGRQGAPKFPMPASYNFMMHYANPSADDAVRTGLMAMAYGGIYDQLRGGFARYSTDALWKVPHFEKMLYDNAQLISVYANAYQKTKNVEYKNVVIESLEFIAAEMTSPEGGFYSSLDADSDGEEGTFYIWGQKEINDLLGDKADIISEFYNVNNKGNWEHGKNILLRKHSLEEFCEKNKIDSRKFNKDLERSKSILLKHRNKRNRPATDDKILCSWNALMIKAYVDAYLVIDEAKYKDRAISSAKFLSDKFLSKDYSLKRNYKNGKSSIDAFLDDYAFTIDAFISLYQLDFDQKYLDEALSISRYVIKHFYDKDSGMFFYTSNVGARLIARKMEISDNVIPASNSQMAINLFKLSEYFYEDEFRYMSEKMLSNVIENTKTGGVYYANWDVLLSYFVHGVYNVAILGKKTDKLRKEFQENYLPFVLLSGSNKEDDVAIHEGKYINNKTLIYVCKNKTCDYPVSKVSEALLQIKK